MLASGSQVDGERGSGDVDCKADEPGRLSGIAGDMATGLVAQLIAGLAFTPMDIIKERMQVQVRQPLSEDISLIIMAIKCV